MRVINVRNVNQALSVGVRMLQADGNKRDSRNGSVLVYPEAVATIYSAPWERVLWWPQRDANPFFHLYEALWMLCGRRDVNGPARYAKQMREYSDDGKTFHGAYGYRWRTWFDKDQLGAVVDRLKADVDDRRSVLQMWDARHDLGHTGKDVPCNVMATFQVSNGGQLEMTVFCRSNDIVWGAYGANAVHMSVLQEYVASRIGVGIGTYTQISVNYHMYPFNSAGVQDIPVYEPIDDCYQRGLMIHTPVRGDDVVIQRLVQAVDHGIVDQNLPEWALNLNVILHAHHIYKTEEAPQKFTAAIFWIDYLADQKLDWAVAGREWLLRRCDAWQAKQIGERS